MAGGQAAGHQPGVTAARPRHACTCTATTIEMAPNCFSFSIADLKTTYLLCPLCGNWTAPCNSPPPPVMQASQQGQF